MNDLPGDPNWLLSTVALASTLTLIMFAVFLASRGSSAATRRRELELRRIQTGTTIRLRTLRLDQLEAELALTPDGSDLSPASRRTQAEHELAAAEIAAIQSEEERLEAALGDLETSRPGWLSVLVLGYLAVVGILLPMALLPARSGAFDPAAVWSVAGLQLSGSAWRRLVLAGFAGGLGLALLEVVRIAVARNGAGSIS